ncbi:MAG TPA: hypothetical protein VF388_02235, partial [Lacunisphaera sp.]
MAGLFRKRRLANSPDTGTRKVGPVFDRTGPVADWPYLPASKSLDLEEARDALVRVDAQDGLAQE